jgi:hypothetical protein
MWCRGGELQGSKPGTAHQGCCLLGWHDGTYGRGWALVAELSEQVDAQGARFEAASKVTRLGRMRAKSELGESVAAKHLEHTYTQSADAPNQQMLQVYDSAALSLCE